MAGRLYQQSETALHCRGAQRSRLAVDRPPRHAAVDVATQPTEDQPAEWMQEFRRTVLARRFSSLNELLSIDVRQPPAGLDVFRRSVFSRACQWENALRNDLELN